MSLKITVKEASKLPNIRLTALGTSDPLAVVKFRGMLKAMHAETHVLHCQTRRYYIENKHHSSLLSKDIKGTRSP